MIGLLINTSLQRVEVALVDKNRIIKYKNLLQPRNESSLLQSSIINLLAENELHLDNIERVFLVTGPGSFTAIRVGVIVGKAIAHNLQIPVGVLTTFEYLESFLDEKILLNAGGNSVYKFGQGDTVKILDLEDLKNDLETYVLILSQKQQNKYGVKNHNLHNIDQIWELVYDNFKNVEVENINKIEPNYVKQPNIT